MLPGGVGGISGLVLGQGLRGVVAGSGSRVLRPAAGVVLILAGLGLLYGSCCHFGPAAWVSIPGLMVGGILAGQEHAAWRSGLVGGAVVGLVLISAY